MEITNEIQDRTDCIQKELGEITAFAYQSGSKSLEYQDCMNVAIFTKLAELELKIEELQNRPVTYYIGADPINLKP